MSIMNVKVASATLHFGEEPFISGTRGSGTIFFSRCLLHCVYCQNYQISQEGLGARVEGLELVAKMLALQAQGAHNINLVSPSHYPVPIARALKLAKQNGLSIPIVYNSGGYDSLKTLEMFDGLVDIYLPDIKYSDNEIARKYSGAKRYVEINQAAIFEMFRQVGGLEVDGDGSLPAGRQVGRKGLVVRHLVLPNRLAGSFASLDFLASISKDITLSLMAQYHPCYKTKDFPELDRRLRPAEYEEVVDYAVKMGFRHILTQQLTSSDYYLPDFEKDAPFAG